MLDSGELSTTLQSDNTYSFTNVPAGAYVVRQVLPSGYTQTSPTNNFGDHVTVTNGSTSAGNNFADSAPITGGSIAALSITGRPVRPIYLDTNNNSKLDPGELSTTTTAAGAYQFSERSQWADHRAAVAAGGFCADDPVGRACIHVTVTSTTAFTNEDFANKSTLTRLTGITIGTPGSYNNDGNVITKATTASSPTSTTVRRVMGTGWGMTWGRARPSARSPSRPELDMAREWSAV